MMLWTPHKAIFQTPKISHKNGAMEIWELVPIDCPRGPIYVGAFDVPISKMLVDGGYWVFVSCLTRCEYLNATLKPLHLQEKKMAAGGFKGKIPIDAALQVFF